MMRLVYDPINRFTFRLCYVMSRSLRDLVHILCNLRHATLCHVVYDLVHWFTFCPTQHSTTFLFLHDPVHVLRA